MPPEMIPPPEPFRIEVPDAAIADLRRRLSAVRWPDQVAGGGWRFGTERGYLRKLVDYWRENFDWREQEQRLNRFPHYRVEIAGQPIHFIHQPGSGAAPRPLLLTHGWPSSFIEFLDVIEPLAHPERFGGSEADAFDVVVVSLPGFGYSAAPPEPMSPRAIAGLWRTLMTRVLGYRHFVAHGGDWGSLVTSWLGLDHPEVLAGMHLTMLPLRPWVRPPAPALSAEETDFIRAMRLWWRDEVGFQAIQATKPQTLAYGLTDSPVGLAGWLVEKFRSLGDTGGNIERRFSKRQLCTLLSLYWFTGCINSANWLYWSARQQNVTHLAPGQRVMVPTGYADFPINGAPRVPRSWGERAYDIVQWREMPAGGHFAALEEPEALVGELRHFNRLL